MEKNIKLKNIPEALGKIIDDNFLKKRDRLCMRCQLALLTH